MSFILQLLLLLLIITTVFLTVHIQYHLKVSNSLDVYEINSSSSSSQQEINQEYLDKVCQWRHPVFFQCPLSLMKQFTIESMLNKYRDYDISLSQNKTVTLAEFFDTTDKSSTFSLSQDNSEFLRETCLDDKLRQHYDRLFQPFGTINSIYDIIFIPSFNSTTETMKKTKLKRNTSYRTFLLFVQGEVDSTTIRLHPPNYKRDTQFVDVDFKIPNQCLFVPPYWTYSIMVKGGGGKERTTTTTTLFELQYFTLMNHVAVFVDEIIKNNKSYYLSPPILDSVLSLNDSSNNTVFTNKKPVKRKIKRATKAQT
jgi:hypothetical protein